MKTVAQQHMQRANVAAEIGRYEVVDRECRAALAAEPASHVAYELLAWSLMEQRKYRDALLIANEGLAIHPDRAHLHYIAGVVLHRVGQLTEARLRAESALTFAPNSARYHVRLARILLDQRDVDGAVNRAREGLAHGAEDPFVLGEVALVLSEAGLSDEGLELAKRRLVIAPDDLWSLAGLLRAQSVSRRFVDASQTAREVIAKDPNLGWAWALYAEALDACGAREQAEAAAHEALRLSPGTSMGGAAMARILCDQQAWDHAERVARIAVARDPMDQRAVESLALARSRSSSPPAVGKQNTHE